MIRLDNRLQAIASFVPAGCAVADIGTDHGRLPVYLLETGRCASALAVDISVQSLNKAKILSAQHQVPLRTRSGNGIAAIVHGEADTLVMAGMGGTLISEILEEGKSRWDEFRCFVFQPMSTSFELRSYLCRNGFIIEDETIACQGKRYYEIIRATRGKAYLLTDAQCLLGPVLCRGTHPLFPAYAGRKLLLIKKVLKGLEQAPEKEKGKRAAYIALEHDVEEIIRCHADTMT